MELQSWNLRKSFKKRQIKLRTKNSLSCHRFQKSEILTFDIQWCRPRRYIFDNTNFVVRNTFLHRLDENVVQPSHCTCIMWWHDLAQFVPIPLWLNCTALYDAIWTRIGSNGAHINSKAQKHLSAWIIRRGLLRGARQWKALNELKYFWKRLKTFVVRLEADIFSFLDTLAKLLGHLSIPHFLFELNLKATRSVDAPHSSRTVSPKGLETRYILDLTPYFYRILNWSCQITLSFASLSFARSIPLPIYIPIRKCPSIKLEFLMVRRVHISYAALLLFIQVRCSRKQTVLV